MAGKGQGKALRGEKEESVDSLILFDRSLDKREKVLSSLGREKSGAEFESRRISEAAAAAAAIPATAAVAICFQRRHRAPQLCKDIVITKF